MKGMHTNLGAVVLCILGVAIGFLVHLGMEKLGALQRPHTDHMLRGFDVSTASLRTADRWLSACEVRFVPLEGLVSHRRYAVLLISCDSELRIERSESTSLLLTGYLEGRSSLKPILLKHADLIVQTDHGRSYARLLEFGGIAEFAGGDLHELKLLSEPE